MFFLPEAYYSNLIQYTAQQSVYLISGIFWWFLRSILNYYPLSLGMKKNLKKRLTSSGMSLNIFKLVFILLLFSSFSSTSLTFIFQLSGWVSGAEVVFIQWSLEEVLSLPHQSWYQFIIPIHLRTGDFCLSFIPPFSPHFFVWFKSAHSLSNSAHKGQSSVCHISPFPVCLIDQSGIFSWHSTQPQTSHAPKRHQILVEFALLHVSAAVMHPDEWHFDYCRLKKWRIMSL